MPLIAAVLKTDVADLLAAAGFTRKTAVVSFDQPFPVDGLTPDSFERFCRHFLQAMYPEARVDMPADRATPKTASTLPPVYPTARLSAFSAKGVGEFRPQKVHAAVGLHRSRTSCCLE